MAAAKLHQRKARQRSGFTLIEGPHLLDSAISAGATVDVVFSTEPLDVDAEVVVVTPEILGKLAATEHPRGPVAVVAIESRELVADHCLVLWDLADPGNVGTLIRTAAAFGLDVVTTPGTADVWGPKVMRSAAGGHFAVGLGEVADMAELHSLGYRTLASVVSGGAWPDEVQTTEPSALLIGNEAHGLPDDVAAAASVRVSIRMPGGAESFNAGVAGSILAYAIFGG